MKVTHMAKLNNIDINRLLGIESNASRKEASANQASVSFSQPNWSIIATKGGTLIPLRMIEKAVRGIDWDEESRMVTIEP